jgi:hypothetical protein
MSVMQRGILGQFQVARDEFYGHPFFHSLAQDQFWLCFKVLEVIGNTKEDTLAAEGFYSPEKFPYPNYYQADALDGLLPH